MFTATNLNRPISVIIPAFNEEKGLEKVLKPVCDTNWINEIIIVDDGSTDRTLAIAMIWAEQDTRLKVIRFAQNQGKGSAVCAGVKAARSEYVILLDADLIGLKPYHLQSLCEPVLSSETIMSVAVFRNGGKRAELALRLTPNLSGQRCMPLKAAQTALNGLEESGYGVEMALTRFAKQHKWSIRYVVWRGLTHTMKEEKLGWFRGLQWRQQMYTEIFSTLLFGSKSAESRQATLNPIRVNSHVLP